MLLMIDKSSGKTLQKICYDDKQYPSALLLKENFLFVGLTIMTAQDVRNTCPHAGRVIRYKIDTELKL